MVETPHLAAPPSQARRALSRSFLLLWGGQFVSLLGSQGFFLAMAYWTMEATGSASAVGLLGAAATAPGVLVGPLCGVLADRFSRRRILILCDVVSGFAGLALGALFFARPAATGLLAVGLLAVGVVYQVAEAAFAPALDAVVPDLVRADRLPAANSLINLTLLISAAVGKAGGGALYAWVGAPMLFLIDGVTFLFAAACEALADIPRPPPRTPAPAGRTWAFLAADLAEALRFLRSQPGLLPLLSMTAFHCLLTQPFFVLLPFYVARNLERGAGWYGMLYGALSAGAFVGYAAAPRLAAMVRRRPFLVCAALAGGPACYAVMGVVYRPEAALALATLAGTANSVFGVAFTTVVQLAAPSAMRGRVMGLVRVLGPGAAPIGMALGGVLGDLTGKNIPLIYGVCGSLAVATSLLLGSRKDVRQRLAGGAVGIPA